MIINKIWICDLQKALSRKKIDWSFNNAVDNLWWRVFHVTLLICAYFQTISYYFCVSDIESTRNWRITYLFHFMLKFLGLSRFLLCVRICLLILNQEKCLLERLSPGKNASQKECLPTEIPSMKIYPEH